MRPLAARELLQVWEWGEFRHPIDQAVTLLDASDPDSTWDEITHLSIGQRDARLLAFHEMTYGPSLAGFAECPACRSRLEFNLDARHLLASQTNADPEGIHDLSIGDLVTRFRLPNSRDLAEITSLPDLPAGRSRLINLCVVSAHRGQDPVSPESLSDKEIDALAARIAVLDPLSEIRLELACAECGHGWEILFDIQTFLWREIREQAQQLLQEVHMIAGAYGWTEETILALSPARRQQYLGLILQ